MKQILFFCLVAMFATLTSCDNKVKVTNTSDAEVIPVRMIGSPPNPQQPPAAPISIPRKVSDYQVLTGGALDILVMHVKDEMKNKWQPFGGVFEDGHTFYQAMVKYE